MKFFTDFWEEMNDVKMIDKKIGQPKLYDDQRVFWYKVVYRTFYRKKTFIELKKNFENSIWLFIYLFFLQFTLIHTHIYISSTSKLSHHETLLWC